MNIILIQDKSAGLLICLLNVGEYLKDISNEQVVFNFHEEKKSILRRRKSIYKMSFDEIETWEVKLPGLAMFVLGKKIFIFP